MPLFAASRDRLELETSDPAVRALAMQLWRQGPDDGEGPAPLHLDVEVNEAEVRDDPETGLRWEVTDDETRLDAPGISLRIRPQARRAAARIARGLLESRPDLVTRLGLESPVTAMKMVSKQLLHAGAVVGPAGAAVLRGRAGAGKSTLVAACWASGLGLLGDESLLVDRDDPDDLEATLREVVLTPEAARLLRLEAATLPCLSGGELKRRVKLPAASPSDRLSRRAATVLLGPREPGPARLVPVSGPAFLAAFGEGEIPQERMYGAAPESIARVWDGRHTYLLLGSADLSGAIERIGELLHGSPPARDV